MTGFSDAQTRLLAGKLQEKHVRTRDHHGLKLSYIEGWHAIDEANRVFGFDGWDRETLWAERVWEDGRREPKACSYAVRVRIRVRAGDRVVCRDGSGVGHGTGPTLGEAHESAIKEAETDATKRALTTFGNVFGLALYDKAQNGVKRSAKPTGWNGAFLWHLVSAKGELRGKYRNPQTFCAALRDAMEKTLTAEDLDTIWLRNTAAVEQLRTVCPELRSGQGSHYADILERLYRERLLRLKGEPTGEPIDKSELALATPKRVRDEAHRKYVGALPCLVCGRTPSQAHHLRFAQPRAMGSKVSDEYTVPLCALHHRALHDNGPEEKWWQEHGIEPLKEAERLWRESHQPEPADAMHQPPVAQAGE
jgi:hypothetical protein